MATTNNILLKNASGQIGKQLVFKNYGELTVIAAYPDISNRVLSAKQLRVNRIMKDANYEAKRIMANEELRNAAQVRLNVTSNKLYTSLIREFFAAVKEAE